MAALLLPSLRFVLPQFTSGSFLSCVRSCVKPARRLLKKIEEDTTVHISPDPVIDLLNFASICYHVGFY